MLLSLAAAAPPVHPWLAVLVSFLATFHSLFAYPIFFWLFTLLPVLSFLGFLARRRQRKLLARLGPLLALRSAASARPGRHWLRRFCLSLGLTLLVVGMAGPQWGQDWSLETASGRDIVVVLDISRSMLAERPSRQQRAQEALFDLCRWAERRGGHRLALVVFAGKAKVVCPLTHDYDHFRLMLQQQDAAASPPDLRPTTGLSASGTRIGAGLKAALGLLDPRFSASQDIVLVSDGDDPVHDGEWVDGVKAAQKRKVPVDVVGVGDPETAKYIPMGTGFLEYQGEPVETKMEEETLKEIATLTNGSYFPARTRRLPLGELYQETLENRQDQRAEDDDARPVLGQRYAWFLGPALFFLTATLLLGQGRRWRKQE